MKHYTKHIAGPYKAKPEDAPYFPISMREKMMLGGQVVAPDEALALLVSREYCLPQKHPAVREAVRCVF
jgi:hypothetical protein